MTGIQRIFLFSLSASLAAGGTYLGVTRVSAAARTVEARHLDDAAPVSPVRRLREIMRELGSPSREEPDAAPAALAGFGLSAPESPAPSGPVAEYDPATLAELQREGIDLSAIVEIREMMRIALAPGDSPRKLKMALELKRRFNLEARPETLAKLERVGAPRRRSLTARGRALVAGVVESVVGVWDRLLGEVDR